VVVDSNVKKVQHPTGGVVGEVRVRDGDRVKAGDTLVRLDETVTRANVAIVHKGLIELYARKARLAAERDGVEAVATPKELADKTGDADVQEALGSERKLFELRRTARLGQKQQLRQRIAQLQEEIRGLEAQQAAKTKETELIEQELVGMRELWKKNLIPIDKLTALERETARLQGERGQLIASAAQAKGKIAETELQVLQVDQDLSSDVAKELRETDGKIGEYVERKVAAEDQLKRTDIRARRRTASSFSRRPIPWAAAAPPAIRLCSLFPKPTPCWSKPKVDPKDIDKVQFGQAVLLRFSAFDIRTTPEINGTVARVAADTSADQRTGQTYYVVRIAMTPDEIARLGNVRLTPGMPVEAFIQTGQRTMLSYLIKPLHDQFMRAFRER
jgi:HlyD family secretion protein